jgi:hypothetical protein
MILLPSNYLSNLYRDCDTYKQYCWINIWKYLIMILIIAVLLNYIVLKIMLP